ncbi:fasciclin domain-containing protein [Aquabacterium sp.]|uniref:fasciclin domain-containing protein n=1 Tax=Aquabacterium sp. TaxID=1872578 RepID=UPI0027B9CBC1|nr:fasciclin domain-containing protein [Aquabacterium sp.]
MNALSKRQFLKLSLASGVALSLSACGGGDEHDIVEVLSDYPEYSLLVEAVQAAGLVGTLKGSGPFTVFAPNNTAFANLLSELSITKDALFANKPLLTAVLTYHVLPARVSAADIPFGRAITTVETGILKIDNAAGGPVITDERNRTANIKVTNLYARNGVIHGIDKVILPGDKDIVATAQSISDFSILVEAVIAANLVSTLQGPGPFTVFAPTNAAFAAALSELDVSKEDLFANTTLLTQILTYHVVPARVLKAEVPLNTDIITVEGTSFQVNNSLRIVDVANRLPNIVTTDVLTTNGVIHVIDRVILPFDPSAPV